VWRIFARFGDSGLFSILDWPLKSNARKAAGRAAPKLALADFSGWVAAQSALGSRSLQVASLAVGQKRPLV
jgi:hypothetical protein